MSTGAKSGVGGLRFFLRFVPELWDAESVERVYALTLDAVQEIFKPDRAFVALSESKNLAPDAQEIQRGSSERVPVGCGSNSSRNEYVGSRGGHRKSGR